MKISIKKISSCILALFMAIGLTTICAFADDLPDGVEWSGSSDAITYSDSTITISGDGTLKISKDVTASIVVSSGTVTIDVDDNATLTSDSSHTVWIKIGATVTLEGGTYKNTANNTSNSSKAVVFNEGTCTIESGTYTNSSSADKAYYCVVNHGTMTINDGTFTNDASVSNSALIENGYYSYNSSNSLNGYAKGTNSESPELTINGGTFTATGSACVKNDDNGTLTIYDGTFIGAETESATCITNWNICTIYGGTYTMNNGGQSVIANSMTSGSTINQGDLTIDGGTYTGSSIFRNVSTSSTSGNTVIYDGTFNGDLISSDYESSITTENITIYHGEFTDEDASDYVVTASYTDEDGNEVTTYVVSETDDEGNAVTYVHALVLIEAVDATCTEDGNIEYYYCTYDSCESPYFVYDKETETYTSVSEDDVLIDALGHYYDVTSEVWSDDYTTLTVTWTCSVCGDEYTATTTNITSEENEDGTITYKADVEGPYGDADEFTTSVEGTSSDTIDTTDSVDTGDASHVYAWLTMMLAAGFVLIGKGVYTIKRNR